MAEMDFDEEGRGALNKQAEGDFNLQCLFDACKELLLVLRTESGSNKDRHFSRYLAVLKRQVGNMHFRASVSEFISSQLPFEASS